MFDLKLMVIYFVNNKRDLNFKTLVSRSKKAAFLFLKALDRILP